MSGEKIVRGLREAVVWVKEQERPAIRIAELQAENARLRDALEPFWQRARTPGAERVSDDATVTVFMKDCREALAALSHPASTEETKP